MLDEIRNPSKSMGFISSWKYNDLLRRIEAISDRLVVAKESYWMALEEKPDVDKLPGVLKRLPPNRRIRLAESYLKDLAFNENRLLDAVRITVMLRENQEDAENKQEEELTRLVNLQRQAEDIITFMERHHVRYRAPG